MQASCVGALWEVHSSTSSRRSTSSLLVEDLASLGLLLRLQPFGLRHQRAVAGEEEVHLTSRWPLLVPSVHLESVQAQMASMVAQQAVLASLV